MIRDFMRLLLTFCLLSATRAVQAATLRRHGDQVRNNRRGTSGNVMRRHGATRLVPAVTWRGEVA
jgi:hypothetical protein